MKASNKGRKLLVGALLLPALSSLSASAQTLLDRAWGIQAKFGVDAPNAWANMKNNCGNSKVVVAVIDTGIDMSHPALKDSLWVNEKELNGKPGVDDDKDGFVDDINGWDFARNSGKLVDNHGHGSHISGIIAGRDSSSTGFRGVCPGVKIMALRYYDENASGLDNLRNTVKAIEYAVKHGANIINYSGGGAEFSQPEYQALRKAESKGILVVAAAGNERSNADENLYFPAAYPLGNIISVTAIDERGGMLGAANWGVKKVHVAAPGQSILSALPNGGYGFMSGTSQATAFVSGIAAMMLTENPKLDYKQIKTIIEASSQKYPQLIGKTKTGAKVNAPGAVKMSQQELRALSSTK